MKPKLISFQASKSSGKVSALLLMPDEAKYLFIFGHGAGAGMRHKFMDVMSAMLAERGVGTFRYQFPYIEKGSRRPDPRPILLATVRSAVEAASKLADGLPMIAGGKSMGGRMTSLAAAEDPLPNVKGLTFLGFPLHPAGRPSTERGDHLADVSIPMLFLQGTRDALAELTLLQPICERLGARATLQIIDGADHSFHVTRGTGKTDSQVMEDISSVVFLWCSKLR